MNQTEKATVYRKDMEDRGTISQPSLSARSGNKDVMPPWLKRLSVVVPLYNEEENIEELHRRLTEVFSSLGIEDRKSVV